MGLVTIEESDDEKSIVTPNCSMRFRRVGQRWTHVFELGPDRVPFARAIEPDPVTDDFRELSSPVYEDLHLQADGEAWLAMLVGRFGPRHFSATYRVKVKTYPHLEGQLRTKTTVDVDVADRCRDAGRTLRTGYDILAPGMFNAESSAPWNAVWELPGSGEDSTIVSLYIFNGECPDASVLVEDVGDTGYRIWVHRPIRSSEPTGRLIYYWYI